MIAIRLDPPVLLRFKEAAKVRNVGYQTLINDVLAKYGPRRRKASRARDAEPAPSPDHRRTQR
jgi:hypothetical protein